jgi:nucleotide-binding universal stress UspA family protein
MAMTKGDGLFKRIVVGTDGSETASEAVRQAIELAQVSEARLDIVAAFEPVAPSRLREEKGELPGDVQYGAGPREDVNVTLDGAVGKAKQEGVEAEPYPREGDPADAILDVAEEIKADLIVVGNKGMTGAKRFVLGSVPNKVSHHAPCAVLIVRTT